MYVPHWDLHHGKFLGVWIFKSNHLLPENPPSPPACPDCKQASLTHSGESPESHVHEKKYIGKIFNPLLQNFDPQWQNLYPLRQNVDPLQQNFNPQLKISTPLPGNFKPL